ncbi:zinc ABC transporter solute-binding protein [Corynebacterium sp. 4HC-13]|uniref:metal ABC transporter solute-binding protein, Zn/Mn family n=1 Tax=Corynebacterium anserum TaxID=2684406 RepID=UPI00163A88D6|nr:zinc ABC transporter substrate-binding protein [Corynebacterium anserum]MBC2681250.1 zinc ABC transporter solute-binding protein [Corynebacterium anserum]
MKKKLASLLGIATLTMGVTACADGGSKDPAADNGTIKIVASTSIWGDIAKTVAGDSDKVKVVSILSSTDDDPHEYEATAKDLAELDDADIVVGNGGGYDNWLTDHVKDGTELITAAPLAEAHHHHHGDHDHGAEGEDAHGHDHGAEGEDAHAHGHDHSGHNHGAAFVNDPHVWMDLEKVDEFAEHLAKKLHEMDNSIPEDSAKPVEQKTDELEKRVQKLKQADYILTEPVAYHLIAHSAFHDVTPSGFAKSIASESEPSAADIAAAQKVIKDGGVNVVITNQQSQSPASQELISAAKEKNVSVVNINETPEPNQSYFDYVDAFLSSLEDATK